MNIGFEEYTIIQIQDVSDSVLYTEAKTENQVLSMTNATVSHELRNPLNSIKAQNIMKTKLYTDLRVKLQGDTACQAIITQLEEG